MPVDQKPHHQELNGYNSSNNQVEEALLGKEKYRHRYPMLKEDQNVTSCAKCGWRRLGSL